MIISQKKTKFSLQFVGKMLLCLYIILSFITSSGFVPSILHSLSLYAMVGTALLCFATGSKIKINKYLIWYFLFVALAIFSIFYTPISDWWSTIYSMLVILAVSFAFACFINDKKDLYAIVYAFAIGASLLVLMLIFSGRLHEDERLGTTVMDNANTFAAIYMVAILLSIWYVLYGEKRLYRLLIVISIALNFYALMLSGGRKYVLVPFLFAYIALIFKTDRRGKKHIFFYTILVAVLLIIVYLLVMNVDILYNSIGVRIEGLIDSFFGDGGDGSSEIRKKMIALAWERGWENPLMGHGINSFKHLNKQVLGQDYYSHNNWMEIWYNHGLIGMLLYYGFYIAMVVKAIKIRKEAPSFSAFVVAAIISTFIFEFGAVTYSLMPIQMVLCLCAIVNRFSGKKRTENGQDKNVV